MSSEERSTGGTGEVTIPGWGSVEFGRRLGLKTLGATAAVGGLAALTSASAASAAKKSSTSSPNFIPLTQKGAPSGVAALDASENVLGAGVVLTGANPIVFPVATINGHERPFFTVQPTGGTHALGPFQLTFIDQEFGGVLETSMSFGYNPNGSAAPTDYGTWFGFLPDCGDSTPDAMEVVLGLGYPDGSETFGFEFIASRSTTTKWFSWNFQIGSVGSSTFAIADTASHDYLVIGPGYGGTQFQYGNVEITTPGNAVFILNAAAASLNAIQFLRAGTAAWYLYDEVGPNLYFRDMVNALSTISLVAGAVGAGSVSVGQPFFPYQAATASAPAYVKGGMYFDTTLNKLRIGGASAWETVTSA